MFTIEAKMKEAKASNTFLRENGLIPAVLYGGPAKTTGITVILKEFEKVLKGAGESSTVTVNLDGKKVETLIHDVQFSPVTNKPVHADFLVIDTSKPIDVTVPIEFTGVAPAVKGGLGTLVKVMHEIEVRALPKDLPHSIVIDLGNLVDLESQIAIKDVILPSGVTATSKPTEVVASIATIKEEKESVPVDLSAIEVEKKGKKEEESESTES